MNITYWLIVSTLLIIALLIIIPPLWTKKTFKNADAKQRNVGIAQDKARDLKQQLQRNALTQQQFDTQYQELALSLSDDLDDTHHTQASGPQGRWIIPVLVLFVPLFSFSLYFMLGEPNALKKGTLIQATNTAPTMQDINVMLDNLATQLQQKPNDAQGWIILGRSYKYLERYELAVQALAKAYTLVGDEPELMLDYADSLVMTQGNVSAKAAELVFKALEKQPLSISGLWLAGRAKAENDEWLSATQYWQKLISLLPPDSAYLPALQQMIATAQSQTTEAKAMPEQITTPPISKTQTTNMSIKVQVSIDATIKTKVNATDTVFIYATALTGVAMPLAIVQKTVADLPLSIVLNDAMAMMPTLKLSHHKAVKVIARITKSGSARRQKGDYIGELTVNKLHNDMALTLVINQKI